MVRTDYLNDRPNTPDNPPPTKPLEEEKIYGENGENNG